MSLIRTLQCNYGMNYARARIVAERLAAMAAGAREAAQNETLCRPENKLADEAVRLGVARNDAKSVAFEVLDATPSYRFDPSDIDDTPPLDEDRPY